MEMMTNDSMWQAVCERDADADGRFYYGVSSTGIFCRPVCSSRRPKRENVTFFADPQAALAAGYRPCKRCQPLQASTVDPALEKVLAVCQYIEDRMDGELDGPPTLTDIAERVGGHPHHLQRTFKRLMGVTPAQYADARRLQRLKSLLKDGDDVTGALYDAGYGAASRLYERSNGQLGMTPATYAKGGKGARIGYAITDSPLGRLMVAATERGVCFLSFGDDADLVADLTMEYPQAEIVADQIVLGQWVQTVLDYLKGRIPHPDLPLDVRGTAFQRRVWEELMRIPAGVTVTYSELAERVSGSPDARRAVARGCATNPVSMVIPCHRVVRGDGGLGGYRWGLERKRALLEAEREGATQTA